MNTRTKRWTVAALAALLTTSAALAQGPGDYAMQWPVRADGQGAYAITLTPEMYARVRRADLSDLAAFNGAGEPLAFGPLPPALVRAAPRWREARWFALPAASSPQAGDLHLHVTRDAAGNLSFDATAGAAASAEPRPDLLVDVQPGNDEAIDQLEFVLPEGTGAFNVQLQVEASTDLQQWTTLVPAATVARLLQGDAVLERRLVELPPTSAPYLRLRNADPTRPLPLQAVRVRLQPAAPERRLPDERWLEVPFVKREGKAFHYRLPARVSVERLDIVLGSENAVDSFVVTSRPDDTAYWQMRGGLTAFRLRGAGVELDNDPIALEPTRDREWRLDASTELAQPPVLRLAFRPETWLLLTHGAPPYVIAAGSARARRDPFPLDALYSQVQARYGADWQPPAASVGPIQPAGGEAALNVPPPDRTRERVLWAILLIGALAVVGMVVVLLRQPSAAAE
jgi:hypothetical protein